MLRKNSEMQDYILKVPMYMKYSQKELMKLNLDQWLPGGKCGNNLAWRIPWTEESGDYSPCS